MKRLGCLAEGALLLGLAGFLARLVQSGLYFQFLNPRFMGLTLATAAALLLMGLARLADREAGARPLRCTVLTLFLGLAVFALAAQEPGSAGASFGTGGDRTGEAGREPSRYERHGREYLRLNLAELALLEARARDTGATLPPRVAVTGMVRVLPDQDGARRFLILRLVVNCCLADATAVACQVRPETDLPLADGQWVRVFARPGPLPPGPVPSVDLPGVSAALVNRNTLLQAEDIHILPEAEMPFIFEVRDREPFAG